MTHSSILYQFIPIPGSSVIKRAKQHSMFLHAEDVWDVCAYMWLGLERQCLYSLLKYPSQCLSPIARF